MGTSIDKQGNVITGLGGPINVNENLLRMSTMNAEAQANFAPNNSEDWTKYFRYYNGSAAIHSFKDGVDTITLNQGANLGIAFQRSATDIELDPNSYYIISCEAKCSKESATLDTGLSYYKTSNSWNWKGGQNPKAFKAVNTWQKFGLRFKPAADTQYICYCFTVKGTNGGTDTFSIRHCKLEKTEETTATPWIPNVLDTVVIGEMSGFNEIESNASFAKEAIFAKQFYEI